MLLSSSCQEKNNDSVSLAPQDSFNLKEYLGGKHKKDKKKKDKHKKNKLGNPKEHILNAIMDIGFNEGNVEDIYKEHITSDILNFEGSPLQKTVSAEEIILSQEFHKEDKEIQLPIYKYKKPENKNEIIAYIIPMYGRGFWGEIYGYLALNKDLKTIRGISFDYNREKWGKIIKRRDFVEKYVNKSIFDENGKLQSIHIKTYFYQKIEASEHTIDVMISGKSTPTTTYRGINEMLSTYLKLYLNFIQKNQSITENTKSN